MTAVSIERQGTIAIVRLDRGGRANAMSFSIMAELTDAARSFESDHELRAVVLTGTSNLFSAGMDLRDDAFSRIDDMDLAEVRMLANHGPRLARAWAELEVPTICAIEGACLAGGLALAAMCDFRVAGRSARFGAPEVAVAHNMGWHSVPRLVRLVGVQATRRILLAGEEWDGARGLELGFVDWLCEDGDALAKALERAGIMAGYPGTALRMIKRQIDAVAHGDDVSISALDRDQQLVAWFSKEFAEVRKRFGKP